MLKKSQFVATKCYFVSTKFYFVATIYNSKELFKKRLSCLGLRLIVGLKSPFYCQWGADILTSLLRLQLKINPKYMLVGKKRVGHCYSSIPPEQDMWQGALLCQIPTFSMLTSSNATIQLLLFYLPNKRDCSSVKHIKWFLYIAEHVLLSVKAVPFH